LSRRLGWLSDADVVRVRVIHERAGLPVKGAALGADRYLELMAHDKKVSDGTLRLVLLKQIGQAVISAEATQEQIRASIEACC
jgi:3-dehydroquinate synthase